MKMCVAFIKLNKFYKLLETRTDVIKGIVELRNLYTCMMYMLLSSGGTSTGADVAGCLVYTKNWVRDCGG